MYLLLSVLLYLVGWDQVLLDDLLYVVYSVEVLSVLLYLLGWDQVLSGDLLCVIDWVDVSSVLLYRVTGLRYCFTLPGDWVEVLFYFTCLTGLRYCFILSG